MNVLQQLENAPKNLVLYAIGLVGAVVDDYALVTLMIFCVLLGFLSSVLIAATAFFGLYFLMRVVISMRLAADAAAGQVVQSNMQIAAAIAQLRPQNAPGQGTVVDSYNPPDPIA